MDKQVTVTLKKKNNGKHQVTISSGEAEHPWEDVAILMEGIGVLTTICLNNGKTEHNGQAIDDYLKSYIDKVYEDYTASVTLLQGGQG